MPKISIIIPVFNVEKYIERCLNSIINQTFSDIEIVVVDDCSSDNTMYYVEKYARNDGRIKIFTNCYNMGTAWTRMVGYSNCVGEYITFCDSDDWLPFNALELLYKAISREEADVAIGNFYFCKSETDRNVKFRNKLLYGNDKVSALRSLLSNEVSHSLCGKIFRSSLFKKNDYSIKKQFNNSEDAFLFYQIIDRSNRIIVIDEFVYCYYYNDKSSSRTCLDRRSLDCMALAIKKIEEIIYQYPDLNKIFTEYSTYYVCQLMLGSSRNLLMTCKVLKKFGLLRFLLNKRTLRINNMKYLLRSIWG